MTDGADARPEEDAGAVQAAPLDAAPELADLPPRNATAPASIPISPDREDSRRPR